MKAVLCKQFGPPDSLVLETLESPRAGAGEVVLSVRAASVNFTDVSWRSRPTARSPRKSKRRRRGCFRCRRTWRWERDA
jgi:NADPH:quinone reductase-like Zn-dependent oxidoreductase